MNKKFLVIFSALLCIFLFKANAQAPTFTTTPVTTGTENTVYTYTIGASDPNNDPLTFSGTTIPSWLTLTAAGSSTTKPFGSTIPGPRGVASDDNGNVYVSSGNLIYKFTPDGTSTLWATTTSSQIYALAVYDGNLYVSEFSNQRITKIALNNPSVITPVFTGITNGGLTTIFNGGFLYVTAVNLSKVIRVPIASLPATYNAGMDYLNVNGAFGMGFDKNNVLYIAGYFANSIYKYENSVLSPVLTGIVGASDIKIDAAGNLYVSRATFGGGGDLKKYTPDLSSSTTIVSNADVFGMTLTPTGTLIYGATNQNQVYKLETGAILSGTPTHANVGVHPVTLRVSDGTNNVNQSFDITITDPNPPTVSSRTPTTGATSVAINSNISLTFNETVKKGTGNITIKKAFDNSILEVIDVTSSRVSISSATVTIDPLSSLPPLTEVYVLIDATAIKDMSDNAYAGIPSPSWSFQTGPKINQTISWASPTATLPYGTADFTAATSDNSTIPVTYQNSDPSVAVITGNNIHIIKAGTTTFTASQAGDASYNAATDQTFVLTVSKKALTVTADNKSKFQGTANPALTIIYTGFLTGDGASSLTTAPTITTTATTSSAVGTYPITVSGGAATNYSFTYVNGTLTVNPGAPTSVSLAASTVYENQAAGTKAGTLSSTADDPAATFTYSLVSGTGDTDNSSFTIVGDELRTAAALNYEAKSSYSIRVRSTAGSGQSLDQQFTVTINDVNEAPTLAAIADQAICYTATAQTISLSGITAGPESGQTTTLSISGTNSNTLFSALSITAGTGGAATISYTPALATGGTSTITVTVKDNGGTANGGSDTYTGTFTITVNPTPVAVISSNIGLTISKGDIATLTASGGTTYQWANAAGITSGQNSAVLTIRPTQTTTYQVTVANASGCSSIASVTIIVREDYKVEANNLMSPDGDGKNDKLTFENLDMYPNNVMRIFDRAGKLLYEKANYPNDWDGTFQNVPLAADTYFYVLDYGSGKGVKRGYVTIIRNSN